MTGPLWPTLCESRCWGPGGPHGRLDPEDLHLFGISECARPLCVFFFYNPNIRSFSVKSGLLAGLADLDFTYLQTGASERGFAVTNGR